MCSSAGERELSSWKLQTKQFYVFAPAMENVCGVPCLQQQVELKVTEEFAAYMYACMYIYI